MAEQTSRLSIVINSKTAEGQLKALRQNLREVQKYGDDMNKSLSKIGSKTQFAGLAASLKSVQSTLQAFSGTAKNSASALDAFNIGAKNLSTSTKSIATNLNTSQAAMARFANSSKSVGTNLQTTNAAIGQTQTNLMKIIGSFNSAINASSKLSASAKILKADIAALNAALATGSGSLGRFGQASNAAGAASSAAKARNTELANSYRLINTGLQSNAQFLQQANRAMAANSKESVAAKLIQDKLAISSSKVAMAASKAAEASTRAQIAVANLAAASSKASAAVSGASAAASKAAGAMSNAAAAATRAAGATVNLGAASSRAAAASSGAAAAALRLATAEARAAADADRLSGALNRTNTQGRSLMGTLTSLQGALMGGIFSIATLGVLKTADAMQSLNSRIKLVTDSSAEYLAVQGRLRDMAQSNLTQYDSLASLYSTSRRALKQLGKTQNETLAFTDNLTKAMFVGGGAAASQAAALTQLGQSLNSGVLRGEEFNSVAEQAPILLELIADKMGVAQGSLRKLAADGKITSRIVYEAISEATDKLIELASRMPATMGQGLEVVKNKYKFFIDDMLNTTGGFSSIVAGSLISIGKNLDSLIPILVAGGLAWGAYALATSTAVTTSMAAAVGSMTTMSYWFASNTLLINAQITSYFNLTAMINRYNINMMLARLTLASYVDLAKTTALAVQAKATAMANAAKAAAINAAAIVRAGQVTTTLVASARAAAAAIAAKVMAMRSGITVSGAYALALSGVAGTAAVAATAVKGLRAALVSLGSVIKAHPIMIIGSVLLAFVAASKNAEGGILGLSGAMSSLGDAVKVLGYVLVDIIGGIKDVANTFGRFIVSMITNSEKGANESSDMFQIFFGNTEGGFVGILQVMARFADLGGAVMKTFVEALGRGFGNMTIDMSNKFAKMGNFIIDIANRAAEAITSVINGALDKISGAVKYANKLPFVNIEDKGYRATAKKITTTFDENKPLNTSTFAYDLGKNYGSFSQDGAASRLQGHIDSMKGAKLEAKANLDLASAITATGDESDEAKKKKVKNAKKVKEAVDKEREAYERLIETYTQQKATYDKMVWDLDAPFATEIHDLAFELEHASGKFFALPQHLKKNLADMAKSLDILKVTALGKGLFLDLQKELKDLDADNPVKKLANEFTDINNVLSTLDTSLMEDLLNLTAELDVKKQSIAMTEILESTQKQLVLLGAANDLDRQNLEIDYESADLLKKFAYLKEVGLDSDYEALKVALDAINTSQKHLALMTAQKEATKSVYDTVKDLNKEIALFDSTDAMAEFYYDLEKTDKYLHASVESVQALEQALLSLKMLDADKAFGNLRSDQEGLDSSPVGQIMQDYEAKLATIKEYEDTHVEILKNSSDARLEVERAYNQARATMMVDSGEAIFGSISSMAKDALGEQSGVYRAMFAVEKGFAIARSIMAIQTAMASATASLPFPANLPVIAQVAAQGASIISNIKAVAGNGFKDGGYTGNMGSSQVAGVVHGQEYVFDAQSTKRIGVDNLNAMRSGKAPTGGDVSINIINNSSAKVTASDDGQTITITDVNNAVDRGIKRSWTNTGNPNSFESKQLNRNLQAPRRR